MSNAVGMKHGLYIIIIVIIINSVTIKVDLRGSWRTYLLNISPEALQWFKGLGLRIFRVEGLGFRVGLILGLGFGVWGFRVGLI